MRHLSLLAVLATALLAAPSALGGGWATVGIEPLPDGVSPGATWAPRITILQHGRTPLAGLAPTVTIADETGATHTFPATETKQPGVYAARVSFPDEGRWSVLVESGFGESRLTYGPVRIVGGSGADGSGWASASTGVLVAAFGLLLLAGAAVVLRRSRRLSPASR